MSELSRVAPHANSGTVVVGDVFISTYVFTQECVTGFLLKNLKYRNSLDSIGYAIQLINKMAGRTLIESDRVGTLTYLEDSTIVGLVVAVPETSVHYVLTVSKNKLMGYTPK